MLPAAANSHDSERVRPLRLRGIKFTLPVQHEDIKRRVALGVDMICVHLRVTYLQVKVGHFFCRSVDYVRTNISSQGTADRVTWGLGMRWLKHDYYVAESTPGPLAAY